MTDGTTWGQSHLGLWKTETKIHLGLLPRVCDVSFLKIVMEAEVVKSRKTSKCMIIKLVNILYMWESYIYIKEIERRNEWERVHRDQILERLTCSWALPGFSLNYAMGAPMAGPSAYHWVHTVWLSALMVGHSQASSWTMSWEHLWQDHLPPGYLFPLLSFLSMVYSPLSLPSSSLYFPFFPSPCC